MLRKYGRASKASKVDYIEKNITAVIMAGGKGTRIREINSEVPKPMIPILGKPILQYEIETLKKQNITDILLVVGYLGDQIISYFGDGSKFDVSIRYIEEKEPLGTAGALFYLKGKVSDDFLLVNGDNIFDVNIERFYLAHKKNPGLVTILTHPNNHPYDSGVIVADKDGLVTKWMTKEEPRLWYRNRVNAGMHFIHSSLLDCFTEAKKTDLDREVLKPLIPEKKLYIYDSPEYIKDMGTPDRYYQVISDIQNHRPEKRNLSHAQKAIFLDRDGTINRYVGFLTDINQFELLPGVAEAIRRINESDYLAIVVTNQPVVARGEVTFAELETIHNKMETLLGQKGAYLDGLYFCPHHPDKGFPGEVPELKTDCDCRKPKPGMLYQAAKDFHIDLSQSWMIGDGKNDVLCGIHGGCRTAYIGKEDGIVEKADIVADGLFDAVNKILG